MAWGGTWASESFVFPRSISVFHLSNAEAQKTVVLLHEENENKINTVGAYISPNQFTVNRDSCLCSPLCDNSYKCVFTVDNLQRT
jgi:hypothetical protein